MKMKSLLSNGCSRVFVPLIFIPRRASSSSRSLRRRSVPFPRFLVRRRPACGSSSIYINSAVRRFMYLIHIHCISNGSTNHTRGHQNAADIIIAGTDSAMFSAKTTQSMFNSRDRPWQLINPWVSSTARILPRDTSWIFAHGDKLYLSDKISVWYSILKIE